MPLYFFKLLFSRCSHHLLVIKQECILETQIEKKTLFIGLLIMSYLLDHVRFQLMNNSSNYLSESEL